MTGSERAGKWIVWTVAVLATLPLAVAVLSTVLGGRSVPAPAWLCLGLSLVFSWWLLRGSDWARGWIITGFTLGGALAVVQIVQSSGRIAVGTTLVLALSGVVQLVAAALLGWKGA
jgi:hypothetical protein